MPVIERIKIGTERRVERRLHPGTYPDGDHGVVLTKITRVEAIERFSFAYPEVQQGLDWRLVRYDWSTARPDKPPKAVVQVASGPGNEFAPAGFWKRVWLWITFRSPPRLPFARALQAREELTPGAAAALSRKEPD